MINEGNLMERTEILKKFQEYKIVPVIAIEDAGDTLPLVDALTSGGLPLIEITFRTPAARDVIATLSNKRPEILIGAGTILKLEELEAAMENGAYFGVAPGFNPAIVERAEQLKFPFFPGIMTPSDIENALSYGLDCLKYFPAEAAGGTVYLESLSAPYQHRNLKFIPTGGIKPGNIKEYLALDNVIAVGGTWLAKSDEIFENKWKEIQEKTKNACELIGHE